MKVTTLNVNGIRACDRKGLCGFLEAEAPDVVCLQEVRALEHQLPALPDVYRALWHPAEKPGYSGVGLLTRVPPDRLEIGMGVARYDREGRVVRADLDGVTVVSVYVPSGTTGDARQAVKMRFLRAFKSYVKRLLGEVRAEGRELLVAGDVNIAHRKIDLKNWRSNQTTSGFLPEERAWLDGLLRLGLRDAVREHVGPDTPVYSWWSMRSGARARNVGWRLDYQLVTPGLAARVAEVDVPREPVLSDHAPVTVRYASESSSGMSS